LLSSGTNGTCTSITDCCEDIVCYGLKYTPSYTGVLTNYTTGFFSDCVSDENPILSNASCVMTDNSFEEDGCEDYNLVLFNCSANSGNVAV
ncbi:hypothetical protein OVW20_29165, partial [Klebsiella pneumoniae]|uniref:hypothetical protein n=1 Tax=Klebsiella pneumoniae TaxID=573 RepID=UPI00226F2F43